MAGNLVEVTDATFDEEVVNSGLPTVVDFWAPWCGPCRALAPTLEAIADEKTGVVKVCKLNVDDNPETAARFGIRGIPTVIMFKNGEVAGQITGAVPKQSIINMISAHT